MRKMFSIPLSTAVTTSLLLLTGCFSADETQTATTPVVRPAKLFTVEDTAHANLRRFPATTVANQYVDMSFRIAGQLESLPLIEGQLVEQGELLAKLDQRDARSALLNAEANFELAEANFKRIETLLAKDLVSQSEYDTSKARLKSAKAALSAAGDTLDYTLLQAPFTGIIARLPVENHQFVAPQQTVLVLQNTDKLDVRIQVPEDVLLQIKPNYRVSDYHPLLVFPALPDQQFRVTFKEFARKIDPATRSYTALFTLDKPEGFHIVAGMSAELYVDMDIVSGHATGRYIIPHQAVIKRDSDGEDIVWIYQPELQQVTARKVTLGRVLNDGLEILSGLNAGDQIVAAGAVQLAEGTKVKPLIWERGI